MNTAIQPPGHPSAPASHASLSVASIGSHAGTAVARRLGFGIALEDRFWGLLPMTTAIRPRRSVLYMPGSNARAIDKARTLPVDAIILDLEDAVTPEAKE